MNPPTVSTSTRCRPLFRRAGASATAGFGGGKSRLAGGGMSVDSGLHGGLITLRHQLLKLVPEDKFTGRDPLTIGRVFERIERLRIQRLEALPHLVHQDFPVHAN